MLRLGIRSLEGKPSGTYWLASRYIYERVSGSIKSFLIRRAPSNSDQDVYRNSTLFEINYEIGKGLLGDGENISKGFRAVFHIDPGATIISNVQQDGMSEQTAFILSK